MFVSSFVVDRDRKWRKDLAPYFNRENNTAKDSLVPDSKLRISAAYAILVVDSDVLGGDLKKCSLRT